MSQACPCRRPVPLSWAGRDTLDVGRCHQVALGSHGRVGDVSQLKCPIHFGTVKYGRRAQNKTHKVQTFYPFS